MMNIEQRFLFSKVIEQLGFTEEEKGGGSQECVNALPSVLNIKVNINSRFLFYIRFLKVFCDVLEIIAHYRLNMYVQNVNEFIFKNEGQIFMHENYC